VGEENLRRGLAASAVHWSMLRHQLAVLHRSVKRPTSADRLLWAWLCEAWSDWRSLLLIVKPETVIGWHHVFLALAHDRRRVVHFNVTAHPTAEWTSQQLREAFPFDQAPKYLLGDRDGIFGGEFSTQVAGLGMEEVLAAPQSPWQRAYVERAIGTIRRKCLDPVIVFNALPCTST
jgi:hypothetical protein